MQKLKSILSVQVLGSLTLAFVLGVMVAPLAAKWQWWHFRDAFTALKLLFIVGSVVGAVSLITMVYYLIKQGVNQAIGYAVCVIICALPLGNMLYTMSQVKSLPFIHDISTDTVNPPLLLTASKLRKTADNSTEYDPTNAKLQQQAYSDISAVYSNLTLAQTLSLAQASMIKLGYGDIVMNKQLGQLEFSDQTFWFGFVDDVVIRVSREQQRVKIDIRSASRVGKSDIGKNAQRIRQIIAQLNSDLTAG
ncbi:MAG: DUF1499 domain-containing protein [Gammaproteobacteria bacterium]|nr:DUF1499 domain-containing protein [Gammaproteobacteria bacterium]